MALDGIYLSFLKSEILQKLQNSRVEKIYQPTKEEIVIAFRGRDTKENLYISSNASCARINLTNQKISNPQNPPMFCMLLRKHLGSAKLMDITQNGFDRSLYLIFETRNELGDIVNLTLAVEIMARHSNIVLINHLGIIVDSVKRVDLTMSHLRQILPGMTYKNPPLQDKIDILQTNLDDIINLITTVARQDYLDKVLLDTIQGISPIISREIAFFVTRGTDVFANELTSEHKNRLHFYLKNIISSIQNNKNTPCIIFSESNMPKDFGFCEVNQYGYKFKTQNFESFSALLDEFYKEKSSNERIKQRSKELLKLLVNITDRTAKKITLQQQELETGGSRDDDRIFGDIISANMYRIQKGDTILIAEDFYNENNQVEISLDPLLTPAQNAQRYYKLYKKASTAAQVLAQQIEKAEQELLYIDSVFDAVSRTNSEDELNEIREELFKGGYIKRGKKDSSNKKPLKPKKFISSDGFTILCGRNNIQNDTLTIKTAAKNDLWFHTKDIPGSHTVILTDNKEVPDSTITEACVIAAFNSKGRLSSQVPVDYTEIKNVKKPTGSKPGMVIYVKNKTAFVTPDEEIIKKLRCD